MPGPTPSVTTNVSKTQLPKWVDAGGKANYDEAVRIANKPLHQYGGNTVAPLSDTTTQSFQFFKDHLGEGSADTAASSELFRRLGNPQAFAEDLPSYLNPYTNEVIDKSLSDMDRSRQMGIMGNADAAAKAKAFGGSRQAITDGVTNAETARSAGLLASQLRSAGFDSAVNNRRADLSTAGSGLLATGDAKQAQMLKDFTGLGSIGAQEQGQAQKVIDADVSKFNEANNKDIESLNLRLAALGMTPYSSTTNTKQTSTAGTPGFDVGTAGVGILSALLGIL